MRGNDDSVGFSVVIPTRDRPEQTLDAVCSVLRQSVPARQIIVVDDGSADVGRLAEALSEVQAVALVFRPESGGPAAARNAGIAQAAEDWIAFLDSDDLWHPNHLELFSQAVQSHPHATAIVGSFEVGGRRGRSRVVRAWMPRSGQRRTILRLEAQPFTASALAIRTMPGASLCFDENMRVLEDMELIIRLAGGDGLVVVSRPTVSKRKDSPDRAYRAALDDAARRYLLQKYATDFDHDLVARRRQRLRLSLNRTEASGSRLVAVSKRWVARSYLVAVRLTARRRSQLRELLARRSR